MKALGLDLGTHTGIAENFNGPLNAYTVQLATKKEITEWGKKRITRRCDPRVLRLHKLLSNMSRPDIVVIEDVLFSSYTLQVQLWSSLRAAVWLAFGSDTIIEAVPVATLKKYATGRGGADKNAMMSCLFKRLPGLQGINHDAADAAWLCLWALDHIHR
jgi:Holliday junction resolvasome RuvABC endonuclease subunit